MNNKNDNTTYYYNHKRNSVVKKLLNIECNNHDELISKLTLGFVESSNKNVLGAYDDRQTKIIIVGTMIPDNLYYFYFGNKRMFGSIIDYELTTNFNERRKNILSLLKNGEIEQASSKREEFIFKLKESGIAFADLFECSVHKKDSYKDRDIEGYIIDRKLFDKIRKNNKIKIVAVSLSTFYLLIDKLGFDYDKVDYLGLFSNSTNEEWRRIFKFVKKEK